MEPKKYGLIKLNTKKDDKKAGKPLAKASAFFDESDSGEEDGGGFVMPVRTGIKRQDQLQIDQAIEEDPNVYQYDEVYDDMKGTDKKNDPKSKAQNKPKYINNMLKTAERRTKEQELISERKIQKEREKEGDLYKDKETFVTSAYRSKLEEMKKAQLEADRQEKIEAMMDVTKKSDLSGFYRQMYMNKTGESTEQESTSTTENNTTSEETINFNKKSQKRQIRERGDKEEEEEEEPTVIKRSRDPEPETSTEKDTENDPLTSDSAKDNKDNVDKKDEDNKDDNNKDKISGDKKNDKEDKENSPEEEVEVKVKKDRMTVIRELFQKRTVGEVFDEAQKRYFERKALRCS